jgi:transposase
MEIEHVPAFKRWANIYSYAYKMEVIQALESGQMSQRQVTRKYGVARKTIVAWRQKFGNLEKNYLKMGENTPEQEMVELKARLRTLNAENETLKYIMQVIQEEYGEDVVKKYLPALQLKKPPKKKTKSK